jgi:hypothetical protein
MVRNKVSVCLVVIVWLSAACAVAPVTPPLPPNFNQTAAAAPAATSSASVAVSIIGATSTVPPAQGVGDEGLNGTLGEYRVATGDDPTGSKTAAFTTLQDFANPHGPYSGSRWFADDGRAEISKVLAVILYTEGNTNWDVRTAVAARYLWYCAGRSNKCQGPALINFRSYFQPWREPWVAPGFTSDSAQQYKDLAQDLVFQRAGLLTAMIPGADAYVASNSGLGLPVLSTGLTLPSILPMSIRPGATSCRRNCTGCPTAPRACGF